MTLEHNPAFYDWADAVDRLKTAKQELVEAIDEGQLEPELADLRWAVTRAHYEYEAAAAQLGYK